MACASDTHLDGEEGGKIKERGRHGFMRRTETHLRSKRKSREVHLIHPVFPLILEMKEMKKDVTGINSWMSKSYNRQ